MFDNPVIVLTSYKGLDDEDNDECIFINNRNNNNSNNIVCNDLESKRKEENLFEQDYRKN